MWATFVKYFKAVFFSLLPKGILKLDLYLFEHYLFWGKDYNITLV